MIFINSIFDILYSFSINFGQRQCYETEPEVSELSNLLDLRKRSRAKQIGGFQKFHTDVKPPVTKTLFVRIITYWTGKGVEAYAVYFGRKPKYMGEGSFYSPNLIAAVVCT